jgi:hypothetical protein
MEKASLRVSVATLDRVLLHHNGRQLLALERQAIALKNGRTRIRVQPFGGGIQILDASSLEDMLGEIQFDSERSERIRDFRILIPPSRWESVKQYCLRHLSNLHDTEIEATPDRELVEEFKGTLDMDLNPDQYTFTPIGFVIEDHPVPTNNVNARGLPTVRIYRIFEVCIVDDLLSRSIWTASEAYTDQELGRLALQNYKNGGKRWKNTVLALPLDSVKQSYLALPSEKRYGKIIVDHHRLDESVLAILEGVEVPQYKRSM